MHHAHRATVVVLHGLVIVSLLAAGFGGWAPAKAAGISPQEISTNLISETPKSVTASSTTSAPVAALAEPAAQEPTPEPAPGSEEAPTPAPQAQETAAENPSETPPEYPSETPHEAAKIAESILSGFPAGSPLLARSVDEATPSITLAALQAPVPGEQVTLLYQAQPPEGASGFSLELLLPDGFSWAGEPALLDAESNALRLPLSVETQETATAFLPSGMLHLQLDPGITGPFEIHAALLQNDQTVSNVTLLLPESGLTLLPLSGGTAEGLGGQVRVILPPGALTAEKAPASTLAHNTLALRIRPPSFASMPPSSPSGQPFEITLSSQDGAQQISQFAQPITIEVAYDETTLWGSEENLSLVYYDDTQQTWIPLPTQVDAENNLLIAFTDHLTIFDLTLDDWEAARLPSLQSFQTDGFTGAATAAYEFWTPPGPGGLQPSLAMQYHSQAVESAIAGRTQASWVGMGWSLSTGSIERDMRGTPNNLDDDTFAISAAGVDSRLLKGADGNYHTVDESFWRIQYSSTADVWTVWDKDGTKYLFGYPKFEQSQENNFSKAFYSYQDGDCNANVQMRQATWRWSLSHVISPTGKMIRYEYTTFSQTIKSDCTYLYGTYGVNVASYPNKIIYPNDQYQVVFELEERQDYNDGWEDTRKLIFYETKRLGELRIERLVGGAYQTIRRYDFDYTPSIFPGVIWSKGQATQALHTITEKRSVLGIEYSLPATTYTYQDGLHLTIAENGYGGKVEYNYETTPWRAQAIDSRDNTRLWNPEKCGNGGQPGFIKLVGDIYCDENKLYIQGQAYRILPETRFQPGGVTRFLLELSRPVQWIGSSQITVELDYGNGQTLLLADQTVNRGQSLEIAQEITIPADASKVKVLVSCSRYCEVKEMLRVILLPTRYRIQHKKVYDGPNATEQVFEFHFDEPTMNDLRHSAAASESNPYTLPYTEFRGHALARQSSSDGRTQFTFYRQDDIYKGRPIVEMTTWQSFVQDFSSEQDFNAEFLLCPDAGVSLTALYGDPAARLTGDSSERCFVRKNFNLQDSGSSPNTVIGQFLLQGDTSQARLALESSAGAGFALYARADRTLQAQSKSGGSWLDQATLLPPGGFTKDAWYVFVLVVDNDEGFLARIWPREHPEQALEYRQQMAAGQSWRFVLHAQNGQAYLDSYSEGRLYSLHSTKLAHQPVALLGNPTGLNGLGVNWIYPQSETSLRFDGDASWSGVRSSYQYGSYGNLTRKLEAQRSSEQNIWSDVRLAVISYSPFSDLNKYLVGLPYLEQVYRCPQSSLDGSCLGMTLSNELLAAETRYLYDDNLSEQPQSGLLSARRSLLRFAVPDSYSDPRYADETLAYDEWGNLSSSTRYSGEGSSAGLATGGPQPSSTIYDPIYHTYVFTQTNALGHPVSFSYDYDLGLPISMTGPNGAQTAVVVRYDAFGRPLKLIRPGDDEQNPTLQFTYHDTEQPYWIEAKQRIQEAQYAVQRRFYNGLGQLIQTQSLDGGQAYIVNRSYNQHGELIAQEIQFSYLDPVGYLAPSGAWAPTLTTYAYDPLGRQILQTAPDGSTTRAIYGDALVNGLSVVRSVDEKGNSQVALADGLGRTLQVIPPKQNGNAIHPTVYYGYDVLDRLVQVERGGAVTNLQYDLGGRKTRLYDPDMGVWNYSYDATSNLVQQVDAAGCRTTLGYDELNRLEQKSYSGTCSGTPVQIVYDQGSLGIGQRTQMSDGSGNTGWSYDTRGRLVSETRQLNNYGTFVTGWGYNSADLVRTMQYPGGNNGQPGETVTYAYNQRMLPASVAGDYTYLSSASYDDAGRLTLQVLGTNQAQSQYQYFPWTIQGGRLMQIAAGTPAVTTSLLNLYYSYDPAGNILSIQDYKMGAPQTQSFEYDPMQRLLSASASGGSQGVGDYSQGYSYNVNTGNLASKDGVSYFYDDPTHPHAVTALSSGESFAYNANGGMMRKPALPLTRVMLPLVLTGEAAGGSQALMAPQVEEQSVSPYPEPEEQSRLGGNDLAYSATGELSKEFSEANTSEYPGGGWLQRAWDWLRRLFSGSPALAKSINAAYPPPGGDPTPTPSPTPTPQAVYGYDAENRLASVSGSAAASFVYNGDGQRVAATVNGVTTVYIGEYFEWEPASGKMTKYYHAGGQRIAMRVIPQGQNVTPLWLFGDHLGSTSVVANTDGSQHSRQGYKAFGEQRFIMGSLPTKHQYTGQVSHETELGLYFYKARSYQPYLSRWTSPDSIIPNLYNPQDWDRYSYTRSNPLKYTDPDGHNPFLVILGILIYLASIPGDTGPYEVNPTTAAVGDMGLRMADPVDWVYTGIECLNGNCSGTDILLGITPIVNGGMDDAVDATRVLQGAQSAGKWIQRSEYMSDAAREYQRFISGRTDDLVYEIGGYTFDGFDVGLGILKDAKDIPTNFIDVGTNQFKPWVSGTTTWLKQAQNQANAAGDLKIQWLFNSLAARDAMYNLFLEQNPDLLKSIELIYEPMK